MHFTEETCEQYNPFASIPPVPYASMMSMDYLKLRIYNLLRRSERYTKTDMVYVGRSGFWLALQQGLGAIVSFIMSILFARYVSKEAFGIYKYILSIAGFTSALSLNGINTAVTRAVSKGRDGMFAASLPLQLKWSIGQFVTTVAVAVYYALHGNYAYSIAFTIIAICFPLSSTANTFGSYLLGKQNFKTYALYGINSNLIYFVVMATTTLYHPQFVYLVAAFYLSTTLGNGLFCMRTLKRFPATNVGLSDEDVKYAKHLSLMNMLGSVANQVDSIIVYQLLGPTHLATYAFSMIVPDKIRLILSSITSVALPKISEKATISSEGLSRKTKQLLLLAIVIITAYIFVAPFIYTVLFSEYRDSIWYSQIYALSLLILPTFVSIPTLYAQRNEKSLYILNIGVPILKIIISYITIVQWGILGAILAKIVHSIVQMGLAAHYATINSTQP